MMRNSPARSLSTCRCHDKEACEKPWMKRISEPAGLPHSCASIVTPSGALTTSGLYFFSCASPEAEIATIVWSSPFDGFESDAVPVVLSKIEMQRRNSFLPHKFVDPF